MNEEVPIEITSRHDQVSERMREHAMRKVVKLVRFHNRVSRIQIVVSDPHNSPEVELIVHVDSGTTLVAKERGDHFNNAIDSLVVKMERRLKKDQEKRKSHKIDVNKADPGPGPSNTDDDEDSYEDVVRKDLKN
jgi:ribosomal subunit interface protein